VSNQMIKVYGTHWCGDCVRARSVLDKNKVSYEWINIDVDKEGEKISFSLNKGMRSVPTIVFPDGSHLVEPTENQLMLKIKGSLNLTLP
jgi:mycoredoxin